MADSPPPPPRYRVLVVDDHPPVLEIAAAILEEMGCRTLTAATGEEACQLFAAQPGVDLLLTDVFLPGMDGAELAGRLAALQPELRVIFMSGYSDEEVAEHGLDRASAHFLPKPFTIESLEQAVHQVLR